jgi:hypothetical protein
MRPMSMMVVIVVPVVSTSVVRALDCATLRPVADGAAKAPTHISVITKLTAAAPISVLCKRRPSDYEQLTLSRSVRQNQEKSSIATFEPKPAGAMSKLRRILSPCIHPSSSGPAVIVSKGDRPSSGTVLPFDVSANGQGIEVTIRRATSAHTEVSQWQL